MAADAVMAAAAAGAKRIRKGCSGSLFFLPGGPSSRTNVRIEFRIAIPNDCRNPRSGRSGACGGAMRKTQSQEYDAIVIGAGCGGTTAAAMLAKNGYRVALLEQSSLVGGCCSTAKIKGYRFDLGASIVEDTDVIDLVFRRLGTTLSDEVKLVRCEPVYDCMLSDGSRLQIPSGTRETEAEIAKISKGDAKRFRKYVRKFRDFTETALKGFFVMPARSLTDLIKIFVRTPALLKFGSLFVGSYQGALQKYFKNPKILESMSFQSFYVGLPPQLSPAYFAMLPYSEHRGVYYTKGGMGQIPEALLRIGRKSGLEFRQKTRVNRILVEDRAVQGVELADGSILRSKVVVSGINAKTDVPRTDRRKASALACPQRAAQLPVLHGNSDDLPGGRLQASSPLPPHARNHPLRRDEPLLGRGIPAGQLS